MTERLFPPLKWEDREKHNVSIPNKKRVTLTIERKIVEKVDRIAEKYDLSRSKVFEALMKEGLGEPSIFFCTKASRGDKRGERGRRKCD